VANGPEGGGRARSASANPTTRKLVSSSSRPAPTSEPPCHLTPIASQKSQFATSLPPPKALPLRLCVRVCVWRRSRLLALVLVSVSLHRCCEVFQQRLIVSPRSRRRRRRRCWPAGPVVCVYVRMPTSGLAVMAPPAEGRCESSSRLPCGGRS